MQSYVFVEISCAYVRTCTYAPFEVLTSWNNLEYVCTTLPNVITYLRYCIHKYARRLSPPTHSKETVLPRFGRLCSPDMIDLKRPADSHSLLLTGTHSQSRKLVVPQFPHPVPSCVAIPHPVPSPPVPSCVAIPYCVVPPMPPL